MSLVALVDADIIVHRVGFTTEEENEAVTKYRCDTTVDGILQAFKFTDAEFYLSDSLQNNYRLNISPDYKANRKDLKKPKHYDLLKEYLITQWGARISFGMEADDSLGIRQTEMVAQSVICSIDKDLLQIPGSHFNFVKSEFRTVSEEEALRVFYLSVLTGDVTDNIKGIYGIGPAKIGELLETVKSWEDLKNNESLLNDKQKIGLKYYDDLNARIPIAEGKKHYKIMEKLLGNVTFEMVGSYRRKAKDMGDIDILIKDVDGFNLKAFVAKLNALGYVIETLASGKNKFMGICRLSPDLPARRIDIPDDVANACAVDGWAERRRSKIQGAIAERWAEFRIHPCFEEISSRSARSARVKSPSWRNNANSSFPPRDFAKRSASKSWSALRNEKLSCKVVMASSKVAPS
jgi:hypothetical protein